MKRVILLALILLTGMKVSAQSVSGTVYDADTQVVVNRIVEIYTDTAGFPYPYHDTAYTDYNGDYSFTLPQGIPPGVIFRVTTYNCTPTQPQNIFYPYNSTNTDFIVCATNRYIRGTVYKGSTSDIATQAMVFLIREHMDSLTTTIEYADSMLVDSNGFYVFTLPLSSPDQYMVKAALIPEDTADYVHFMPSYYDGALQWSNASVLGNNNYQIDVVLTNTLGMQGQGYVMGTLANPANKRILLLTNANNVPIGYRYTNTSGTFSFGGLNYGTYKLFGDVLGKNNPMLQFTLSSTNPTITTIVFYETNAAFYGSLWPLNVEEHAERPELTIYPNPVADYLHIKGLENVDGDKSILLYNINGAEVYNKSVSGNSEVLVPFAELTPGLYMLHVKTAVGEYHYKVMR